jgi:hypothetical protein
MLVLSCSRTKRAGSEPMPAIQRYDGPAFRVLRRFLRESPSAPSLDIFILSAKHGLIPGTNLIDDYDQYMEARRAMELRDSVQNALAVLLRAPYAGICLAVGQNYRLAFAGWEELLRQDVALTLITEGQGRALTQLKNWLWTDSSVITPVKAQGIAPAGSASLRGVHVRLTPDQVFARAQAALTMDDGGSDHFQRWCVNVQGRSVGPKWLAGILTGLPVHAFSAGESRRFLMRLGVEIQAVEG